MYAIFNEIRKQNILGRTTNFVRERHKAQSLPPVKVTGYQRIEYLKPNPHLLSSLFSSFISSSTLCLSRFILLLASSPFDLHVWL